MFLNRQNLAIRLWSFPAILFVILMMSFPGCTNNSEKKQYSGTFYANDSGVSHGGFEWGGEYAASLEVVGKHGTLSLILSVGLGDPLTRHQYTVADFSEAGGTMNFRIEGWSATLLSVDNDRIWDGKYNNYFSANKSQDSSEQIGLLPLDVFSGLGPSYYIDLRLKRL